MFSSCKCYIALLYCVLVRKYSGKRHCITGMAPLRVVGLLLPKFCLLILMSLPSRQSDHLRTRLVFSCFWVVLPPLVSHSFDGFLGQGLARRVIMLCVSCSSFKGTVSLVNPLNMVFAVEHKYSYLSSKDSSPLFPIL